MDQWMNVQTGEAINPSKFSNSNTSFNPGTTLAIWLMWMSQGMQAHYNPAIFSLSSTQIPLAAEMGSCSFGKAVLWHLISMQPLGPAPCVLVHAWTLNSLMVELNQETHGWHYWLPPGGSKQSTPHSSLQPFPTTVVCFLNKPWDRAMWGYKSAGNQMLTCK